MYAAILALATNSAVDDVIFLLDIIKKPIGLLGSLTAGLTALYH